ncbi:MAG TPA: hypothetical protein VLA19_06295 [Herpetosiphonaceae bacterium]|nr:hypothetical protein [Herpetosiphonaceae bacterium]
MRFLAPLVENPWCLVLFVVLALLVIGGAATVALLDRHGRTRIEHRPLPYAARNSIASAPLEGLAALHEWLLDLQRRLPPGSDDARWLASFARRLQQIMSEAHTRLEAAPAAEHGRLLEILHVEVEALASVINLQLGATLSRGTDRQALEAQISALRAAIEI